MDNTKTLESDRLILRKFKIDDAEGMYNNWASESECCKYLTWNEHKDVNETRKVIQSWIDKYEEGSYNWVVELKDTGEIIGNISVVDINNEHAVAEVGYCYGSKYWGKGYATEALRRVIEYLLLECNLYIVEAMHIRDNPASGRVMQKAGMKQDGVLRDRRINKYTKERNDLIVYSIKRNEL